MKTPVQTLQGQDGKGYVLYDDGTIAPLEDNNNFSSAATDVVTSAAKDEAKKQIKENVIKPGLASIAPSAFSSGASTGLASTAAENAAFNSLATGGEVLPEVAPASGMFSLSGIGSAGNAILPAAGLAGAYDLFANKQKNIGTGKGYLQGALSGAAMGSYFGPVGMGVGALVGLGANAFGIGHQSRTKVEQERRKQLESQGIIVPNAGEKEWEKNEKFRQSRNEADLTGKDIMHSAQLYGIKGYAQADAAKQEAIANEAVRRGLIREHHGTIDVNMDAEYQKFLDSQLSGGGENKPQEGNRRQQASENKQARKRAILSQIAPVDATPTKADRYDLMPKGLMANPYA